MKKLSLVLMLFMVGTMAYASVTDSIGQSFGGTDGSAVQNSGYTIRPKIPVMLQQIVKVPGDGSTRCELWNTALQVLANGTYTGYTCFISYPLNSDTFYYITSDNYQLPHAMKYSECGGGCTSIFPVLGTNIDFIKQTTTAPYFSDGSVYINHIMAVVTDAIVDNDGDGYASDVDCNDNNASIHPNAQELCNVVDDNCDGIVDENCAEEYLSQRVAALEAQNCGARITSLEQSQGAVTDNIATLNTTVVELRETVSGLSIAITALEDAVAALQSQLESIKTWLFFGSYPSICNSIATECAPEPPVCVNNCTIGESGCFDDATKWSCVEKEGCYDKVNEACPTRQTCQIFKGVATCRK